MNVKIRMSRAENIQRFGEGPVSLDIEEYLCGVVPAEMYESASMDALKAQAITARTYALKRALSGTVLGDTSGYQSYKDQLYTALKENGFGDLVYETINANSLSSFVKEQIVENGDMLPAWLMGLINVYEKSTVGIRKAAK